MNTHTPGPWNTHSNIGRKGELGITASAAPCIIAIMGNQKEWPAEAEANARLIATAPDLLLALQALTATARTFRNVPKAEQEWTSLDDDALNFAFATLAKATQG